VVGPDERHVSFLSVVVRLLAAGLAW